VRSKYDPYVVWSGYNFESGSDTTDLSYICYGLICGGLLFGVLALVVYNKGNNLEVDEERKKFMKSYM